MKKNNRLPGLLLCLAFLLALFPAANICAQEPVILTKGVIEFERKISVKAALSPLFWEANRNSLPEFRSTVSVLTFSGEKSFYAPKEAAPLNSIIDRLTGEDNITYTDLRLDSVRGIRKGFGQTYLVRDTIGKIVWKLTDEKRTIAGFECRRANGIILDSIYIVAFYTNDIVPGGPETFQKLPGMILQVVLPHKHISWTATRVLVENGTSDRITPPSKGEPTTFPKMRSLLREKMGLLDPDLERYLYLLLL